MVLGSRTLGWVAAMAWLGACAGRQASGPPPGTGLPAATEPDGTAEEALVADLVQHHRYHHHSGVLMLITMSLDALGLPDEQQARVVRLQQDLLDRMRPAGQAERDLMGALADGIAAQSIDHGKVDEDIRRLSDASAAVYDVAVGDLNELHRILTPAQRSALIDRLEAHWALWKQANVARQGRLAAIGDEIGLRPDQIAKLDGQVSAKEAAPPPEGEIDSHLHDFAAAFLAETFDASTIHRAAGANRDLAVWGAERLATFCEAVNPMLTEDQRTRLVALLREHETHDEAQAVLQ